MVLNDKTWLGYIQRHRELARAERDNPERRVEEPNQPPERHLDFSDFDGTHLPDPVLEAHAPAFQAALSQVTQLALVTERLRPAEAVRCRAELGRFYDALGGHLAHSAEDARGQVALQAIAMARQALERVAPHNVLPTLAAIADLSLAASAAGGRAQQAGAADSRAAARAVLAFLDEMEGRAGIGGALAVYTHLCEELCAHAGEAAFARLPELWEQARTFLAEAAPRSGFNQERLGRLSELCAGALRAHPGDPAAALAQAKAQYFEDFAAKREEYEGRIVEAAAGFDEGTPNRATFDLLGEALRRTLAQNPAGPQALNNAVGRMVTALKKSLPELPDHALPADALAAILDRVAPTPVAAQAVSFLAQNLPSFAAVPADRAAGLQRAAAAEDLNSLAFALLELRLGGPEGVQVPDLAKARDALSALSGTGALKAVLAFLPCCTGEALIDEAALRETADYTAHVRGEVSAKSISFFVERFTAIQAAIRPHVDSPEEAVSTAARLSRTMGTKIGGEVLEPLRGPLARAANELGARADEILLADHAGRPGLFQLVDPKIHYRHDNPTTRFLAPLLQLASRQRPREENPAALVRRAADVAAVFGQLDGDPRLVWNRVHADWSLVLTGQRALTLPAPARGEKIFAPKQVQQTRSLVEFFEAYPTLPPELSITAGVHLSPEQLRWVLDRVERATARDTLRTLRDFVFACVEARRLDLLDAARTCDASPKILAGTLRHVGNEYRHQRLRQLPFELLIQGLEENRDAVADLEREKAAQALDGLNLRELAGGPVDPEGLAEVQKAGKHIAHLLQFYRPGQVLEGMIDLTACRTALLEAIKDNLRGTWPRYKYESEIGRRLMKDLTPAQAEVWKQELVTPMNGVVEHQAGPELADALVLARGLSVALPREVKLPQGAEAVARLREEREEVLAALRQAPKGSPAHRDLGKKMRALSRQVAVLDLHDALAIALRRDDPRRALLSLRPVLPAAEKALKGLGAAGSTEAVRELRHLSQDLPATKRQGHYAVDEDRLEPMIGSHVSGCLNSSNGFRRWGLAGALADANTRMVRVYKDERFRYRGFIRFYPVELKGYRGPAMWLENPIADVGGDQADQALFYRHCLRKAQAMGIPVMTVNYGWGGRASLSGEGEALGFTHQQTNVTFRIPEGHLAAYHSDNLLNGVNIRRQKGRDGYAEHRRQVTVVNTHRRG